MAATPQVLLCPRCNERTPHARFQRSAAPAFGWLVAAVFAASFEPTAFLYPVLVVIAPIHAAVVIVRNARTKPSCLRCASKDQLERRRKRLWRAILSGRATVNCV